MTDFKQSVVNIPELCVQLGVNEFVLCPGSRSAPLSLVFLRHPKTVCRTFVDERSAGFFALGMAQFRRVPVGLVCTSGTAALNFSPAVAEAFYQRVPLIVFTADRPPEWIDQEDGQTIHQHDIFGTHCHASFDTPVDDSHPDAKWHFQRLISDAINTAVERRGPAHINVPLREPLYPRGAFSAEQVSGIRVADTTRALSDEVWQELLAEWRVAERKLVVVGLAPGDERINAALARLVENGKIPVLADVASNITGCPCPVWFDNIFETTDLEVLDRLRPDLVLKLGGPVVSKSLKLFLRRCQPRHVWQLHDGPRAIDTFQRTTRILPVAPLPFLESLAAKASDGDNAAYFSDWNRYDTSAGQILTARLAQLPFCELNAMQQVLDQLPDEGHLHLGNSSVIRLASMVGFTSTPGQRVFSNRGTSGIDGTLSTAVGSAVASGVLTTVILGDLSFFYDRNALWNRYVPGHLRIVLFNNDGGGIFRLLDGPRQLPELELHFEVEHGLSAELTAREHGLVYFKCHDRQSLESCLPDFFRQTSGPAVLEIFFDKHISSKAFLEFKSEIKEVR